MIGDGHFGKRVQLIQRLLLNEPVAGIGGYGKDAEPCSFLDLVRKIQPDTARALVESISLLLETEEFARVPVIGICGLMNSGKSSTTAFHLSAEGRRRINIGDSSEEGTHRFVLWMPMAWKKDRERVAGMLRSVFRSDPEELSCDPRTAAAQYNARGSRLTEFSVPLIAFDDALDQHGIALLDCPDIQRSHDISRRAETAHIRAEALRSAARLCSAFFVVTSAEQQESSDLDRLMEILRADQVRVPLYYIVTKIEENDQRYLRDAEQRLTELGVGGKVQEVFISPRLWDRSPSGFPEGIRFLGAKDPNRNLLSATAQLDLSELQALYLSERVQEVVSRFMEGAEAVRRHFANTEKLTGDARATLLQFLQREFVDEDGAVRSILSKHLVSQMQASIDRTTPWYFSAGKVTRAVGGWLRDNVISIAWKETDEKAKGKQLLDDFPTTRGDDFVNFIQGRRWMPTQYTDEQIKELWNQALVKFSEYSAFWQETRNDRYDLDQITREMWESVPTTKKAVAVASGPLMLLGAIGSVLFVGPIALGGHAVLYSASVAELFAALGFGVMAGVGSSHAMQIYVTKRLGRPQMSALFAVLQDGLGLDRAETEVLRSLADNERLKLTSSVIGRMRAQHAILPVPYGTLGNDTLCRMETEIQSFKDSRKQL